MVVGALAWVKVDLSMGLVHIRLKFRRTSKDHWGPAYYVYPLLIEFLFISFIVIYQTILIYMQMIFRIAV